MSNNISYSEKNLLHIPFYDRLIALLLNRVFLDSPHTTLFALLKSRLVNLS